MLLRTHGEYARTGLPPKHTPPYGGRGLPLKFMCGPQSAADLLPSSAETVDALRELGEAMGNDPPDQPLDTAIPAAFTYFGQFIDHDITTSFPPFVQEKGAGDMSDPIGRQGIVPLTHEQLKLLVTNGRAAPLQLECLYGTPAAYEADGRMKLGVVTPAGRLKIETEQSDHDVPRREWIKEPRDALQLAQDREAIIGDPRNDENLIISQMHCAFLRTHNELLRNCGGNAEDAKRQLRRRYQWAVLHDFLVRICDPTVLHEVLAGRLALMKVKNAAELYLPLEFAGAAYRFGHSMVREAYNYNSNFNETHNRATLNSLFTFTALSGNISLGCNGEQSATLPDSWIIEWPRFFGISMDAGQNPARRIDTKLERQLGALTDTQGQAMPAPMGLLAIRNLLRGYWLGLPTGQAVARSIGTKPMSEDALLRAVPDSVRSTFQKNNFHKATPLWFYMLAEAGDSGDARVKGPNGQHLGKVASRIVAETIWSFLKHSPSSVLNLPPTRDELDSGEFSLRGIIRIGQDRGMERL
jgi:hypothetical protein